MKIEKLSKGRNKKIVLSILVIVLIIGVIYITNSKAKYQVTKSVQIVNGKVNYKPYDFNLVGIYLQDKNDDGITGKEGQYKKADNGEVPTSGYKLKALGDNTYDSHCIVDGKTNNEGITILYENGGLTFIGVKKQGTKCILYFDVGSNNDPDSTLKALKLNSLGNVGNITGPSCEGNSNGEPGGQCYNSGNQNNNMNQNGVYKTEDNFGTSYVFRGTVNNNWVKFGKMTSGEDSGKDIWWRIIRINGNGTVRLIYAGLTNSGIITAPSKTGAETLIRTSYLSSRTQKYNEVIKDNTYVGYMNNGTTTSSYDTAHQNLKDSTIKKDLDDWWINTDLGTSVNFEKIDVETGFCNDRNLASSAHGSFKGPGGGWGTSLTAYAGAHRVWESGSSTNYDATSQEPTLKCANPTRDLFTGPDAKGIEKDGKTIEGNNALTKPVGLITMDEVIYAGGFAGQSNDKYWLYVDTHYWTMTPYHVNGGDASVFYTKSDGSIVYTLVNSVYGIRPVINISADAKFITSETRDKGTSSNPYIIQ